MHTVIGLLIALRERFTRVKQARINRTRLITITLVFAVPLTTTVLTLLSIVPIQSVVPTWLLMVGGGRVGVMYIRLRLNRQHVSKPILLSPLLSRRLKPRSRMEDKLNSSGIRRMPLLAVLLEGRGQPTTQVRVKGSRVP